MVKKIEGCAFGFINREKIEETQRSMNKIESKLDTLDVKITELFNHQSSRWPPGAVWAMGILTTVASVVITTGVIKLFT
jgi:hypothetical protein